MRLRSQKQLYFKPQSADVKRSVLLQQIGEYLDDLPGYDSILEKIQLELNGGSPVSRQGRPGMTAEQVLRALVLKMLNNYSYCLLYTSPSPRDATLSRMPSSA